MCQVNRGAKAQGVRNIQNFQKHDININREMEFRELV